MKKGETCFLATVLSRRRGEEKNSENQKFIVMQAVFCFRDHDHAYVIPKGKTYVIPKGKAFYFAHSIGQILLFHPFNSVHINLSVHNLTPGLSVSDEAE